MQTRTQRLVTRATILLELIVSTQRLFNLVLTLVASFVASNYLHARKQTTGKGPTSAQLCVVLFTAWRGATLTEGSRAQPFPLIRIVQLHQLFTQLGIVAAVVGKTLLVVAKAERLGNWEAEIF